MNDEVNHEGWEYKSTLYTLYLLSNLNQHVAVVKCVCSLRRANCVCMKVVIQVFPSLFNTVSQSNQQLCQKYNRGIYGALVYLATRHTCIVNWEVRKDPNTLWPPAARSITSVSHNSRTQRSLFPRCGGACVQPVTCSSSSNGPHRMLLPLPKWKMIVWWKLKMQKITVVLFGSFLVNSSICCLPRWHTHCVSLGCFTAVLPFECLSSEAADEMLHDEKLNAGLPW